MNRVFLFLFSLLIIPFYLNGQSNINLKEISKEGVRTTVENLPTEYKLFQLNFNQLKNTLANSPKRNIGANGVIINLPKASGEIQRFEFFDFEIFSPELQEKYPEIRSYVGQNLDDQSSNAYVSVSNQMGISVMITSGKHVTQYMDRYSINNNSIYYVYSREHLTNLNSFNCEFENEDSHLTATSEPELESFNSDDGNLRTYRLALACTAEYSSYHLAVQGVSSVASESVRKAAIMSAYNTAMTRVNGIYERDMGIHMNLVSNTDNLIFFNSATDGYSNNNGFAMLGQNQTKVDNVIGPANYDIGHVFSTGGGGVAQLNSPCFNGSKAEGVTGLSTPINDPYVVDYVCHEMGHQYGAVHTQNNNCQRALNSSVEPGSASTIMGYAGICAPNVQNNSDDHFHAISIEEMWAAQQFNCATNSATGNAAPTANAGDNKTVPRSTPLNLQGTATDSDGDTLLHVWEQMDSDVATMPPSAFSSVGPLFRSVSPTEQSNRYLPNINTVYSGSTQNTWEVIPSVSRTMNFRYTVRDNAMGGGSTASDDLIITVNNSAGPFTVTSQNTSQTWDAGTTETVTWNVANTDIFPVNCANVDIRLSTDSGITFTDILLNTPNDSSQSITVPNMNTTTGRIFVQCSDNVFFNVNSANITIEGALSTIDVEKNGGFNIFPNPSNGIFKIRFNRTINSDVELSIYSADGKIVAKDLISASNISNNEIELRKSLASGVYIIQTQVNDNTYSNKLIIR